MFNKHYICIVKLNIKLQITEKMAKKKTITGELEPIGKSSVSCPLKPSDSAPLKHSTMPP